MKCFFEKKHPLNLGNIELQLFDRMPSRTGEIEKKDCDRIFVLLDGEVLFKIRDKVYKARRNNPFLTKPSALYLPCNKSARIEKKSESMLMLSATVKSRSNGIARIIKQKDVKTTYIGNSGMRSKERKIFEKGAVACGEIICAPGKWVINECPGDRALFFLLRSEKDFGFIRIWSNRHDETNLIEDRCVVSYSEGKEAMVVEPGTAMYVLWFLEKSGGERDER
ncbi:MAG: 5-deoxy-glucuronate isomerase [Candidatus Thermoplasmatota archaeon]|nr:5-deoxy-glucuronate isomerase [Candidatus Thermoplasmatota archaeon]